MLLSILCARDLLTWIPACLPLGRPFCNATNKLQVVLAVKTDSMDVPPATLHGAPGRLQDCLSQGAAHASHMPAGRMLVVML